MISEGIHSPSILGKVLYQSFSPVHSDRCELLGILAIVVTLLEIATSSADLTFANKTVVIYSDSITALEYAKKTTAHTTKSAFQNNIDVILEL